MPIGTRKPVYKRSLSPVANAVDTALVCMDVPFRNVEEANRYKKFQMKSMKKLQSLITELQAALEKEEDKNKKLASELRHSDKKLRASTREKHMLEEKLLKMAEISGILPTPSSPGSPTSISKASLMREVHLLSSELAELRVKYDELYQDSQSEQKRLRRAIYSLQQDEEGVLQAYELRQRASAHR
eukprot:TRINITY_DN42530_c0_g1_i1.p1 TRINITY_DN42530_c0_g1~~TRINITY_DN42530_c0_g1_i1.p1  ORF type:complete len:196 (+),score=64.73 TRINITY_DN42530_c0_g1_i1:33-590(+)